MDPDTTHISDGCDHPAAMESEDANISELAAVLSGTFPCWVCKYELSGLSIIGVCPECGTPVRTSLLAVVDPAATSLTKFTYPKLAAIGLVLWSGSAMLATLTVLVLRLCEFLGSWFHVGPDIAMYGVLVPIFAGVSGFGAVAFVRPHGKISNRMVARVVTALMLYIPLVYLLWALFVQHDLRVGQAYFGESLHELERALLRIGIGICIIIIALLIRPTVREYAKRSVMMRTGQLTRQTLLALSVAVAVGLAGDFIHAAQVRWDVLDGVLIDTLWLVLVVISSGLIVIGFLGMFWDSIRLFPLIRSGPIAFQDVIQKEDTEA